MCDTSSPSTAMIMLPGKIWPVIGLSALDPTTIV
eukprot:CAMPEP_0194286548 /NCGR_PEP_ID=MMETSP0169-20130528/32769_1 /TAXON_ID=218684 /ORGANISM="Corethron pennatum, Strain L29A3" /LENGTH=33 /DNA_ID= /DNA_START= /DNA_END= /DNA_ORIENTATION=